MNKKYLWFIFFFCFLFSFLNPEKRDSWHLPEKVMDVIGVKPGMVIGEVGAGEGYFTFKLAKRVGKSGKVYANDIDEKKIRTIRKRCMQENVTNIVTILSKVTDPLFPEGVLDLAIMVYVFHDLEKPVELLENLKPSLKPDALLVILDRDPSKYSHYASHFMTKEQILKAMKKTDFIFLRIETFLPRDNIYIYRLAE